MSERPRRAVQAYRNQGFLNSKDARALRILAEYLEPKSRFEHHRVDDTIVFMGSARVKSREQAEAALREAEAGNGDLERARIALGMSAYYEAARELAFHFHYFFMRKFWFAYLAKAVIVFPGGFGTLDELFELLTLVQTRKMSKPLPIVLFGIEYWRQVMDFDALVRHGTIDARDLNLVHRTDSVDDAYEWVVRRLAEHALGQPGPML